MKRPTNAFLNAGAMLLTALIGFSTSRAQMPNRVLQGANNLLNAGEATIQRATNLFGAAKKTSADFDNSVTVMKTGFSPSAIPSGQANQPKFKHGKFTSFKWAPVVQFDDQIFPAMVVAMAHYKGHAEDAMMSSIKSGALGFYFHADQPFIPVRWEIESGDKSYFDKVSGEFVIQDAKKDYYFMPDIPWNMPALAMQSGNSSINIIYRLYDAAGNKEEHIEAVAMRSVNDCIFKYQQTNLDFLVAAFIQEQHPEVDKIVKEASKIKFASTISGYQGNDLHTLLRVCAVWKVLHDRGFKYDRLSTALPLSDKNIVSWKIRTFDNAIKANEANCIDGTVVFASVLKAMGISTTIIFAHDLCLLGFSTSKNPNGKHAYLETTFLAASDKIDAAKTDKQKKQAYVDQFDYALEFGQDEYRKFKTANDVVEIDVDRCRDAVPSLPFK